jgi:hypothetical protein
LLLVPDGNRKVQKSLLTCTGDNGTPAPCPAVVLNCSLTTGLCTYNAH